MRREGTDRKIEHGIRGAGIVLVTTLRPSMTAVRMVGNGSTPEAGMELPKALAKSVNSPDPFSRRGVVAPAPTHDDPPSRSWDDRGQRAPYRTDHRKVRERERGQSKFAPG